MNIRSIITAALALLVSTACIGGVKQQKVMNKNGKALVVFFSHAGDFEQHLMHNQAFKKQHYNNKNNTKVFKG